MTFWANSLRIFKCLCDHGTQSIRQLAQRTGLAKSSVHRLTQAMERRDVHPESWLWETEEGRQWLTRLVVATLYTFGLKRGVGLDTMSEFFARLRLERQVGCSPSALRKLLQVLEAALLETAGRWEKDGVAAGEVREIIGAVDETFLEQMILVFQDVPTGYIVHEAVADDRTYATWKAVVDARLTALGTEVLYLVSDRAKALIQLAEQGLECLSMPDFFHVVHEIIKSYLLALGRHLRHAHQELKAATETLTRLQGLAPGAPDVPQVQALVAARHTAVTRWAEAHATYRRHLDTLSLTLHPFRIADSAPQTSAEVASHLQATVEAIDAFAQSHQLPARPAAMTKVRKQLPALAALVDFWWEGVRRDLAYAAISPRWGQWAEETLLPLVYWEHTWLTRAVPAGKPRYGKPWRRCTSPLASMSSPNAFLPKSSKSGTHWATHRVSAFQRTSSAVEGRNGALSQLHHNQRGLPKHRYKVWTVLHNFLNVSRKSQ
jgi:Family of unknown function (DUF6399)/IclR helix-turn-helix domain